MNGMGDLLCYPSLCDGAQVAVTQMDQTYQGVPVNVQKQFQSAHDSIMSAFNTNWTQWQAESHFFVVSEPLCCALRDIGVQATALANNMLAASGQSGLPTPPPTPDYLGELATLAVIGVVAFLVYQYRGKLL